MTTAPADIVIHCDGACSGNPGPGGWGVRIQNGADVQEHCGGAPRTTNNRMELTAAIEALALCPAKARIAIYTDSRYVMDGLEHWLPKWKRNGFRTAQKKPVRNQDLWQALDALASTRHIDWHWVKGHSGDMGNERADALANAGMARFMPAS